MAGIRLDELTGVTVGEIAHSRFSAFPADATVGDVRAWFTESASHKLALLADDGRYVGSLVPEDVAGAADDGQAADVARPGETVEPEEPASRARELALATPTHRVPVVDGAGQLVGIVAVTTDLQRFCGTG
jgi:CBS-domain-containing membrane protein